MTVLESKELSVSLGRRTVLHEVNARFAGPGLIGLLGPNGAGKTTLLRALGGLIAPSSGAVTVDGGDVFAIGDRARALKIAYLPQERAVTWPLLCRDVVLLGRHPHRPPMTAPSSRDLETVEGAMRDMDVAEFADRPISTLSGGEKCRVLIARALAQSTDILLADEPTAALDPAHQIAVMEHLAGIARRGRLVIVTLHDLGMAARWCDRVVVLSQGSAAGAGRPTEVLVPSLLRSVYGIEAATLTIEGNPFVMPVRLSIPEPTGRTQ